MGLLMRWYKASNNLTSDPVIAWVAAKSKSYKHEVIAMWVYMLERASQENMGGSLGNMDFEITDFALDFLPGKSKKIFDAFKEKGKILDNVICSWVKYQADPTAAERQRKSRENKKAMSRNVTVTSSDVTQCHAVTVEERRGEERRRESIGVILPTEIGFEYQNYAMNLGMTPEQIKKSYENFVDHHLGMGTKAANFFNLWKNWAKRDLRQPTKKTEEIDQSWQLKYLK